MPNFQWIYNPAKREDYQVLQDQLGVNPIFCQIMWQRGIKTFDDAKSFFRPSYNQLHAPFKMLNMQKAVDRIQEAINRHEHILFYGDYDVDGTTSVALMYLFFQKFYTRISYYVPDRYTEGYGISEKGIRHAKTKNVGLMIALDCGIKAFKSIDLANELGIDVIVCDHHQPDNRLPNAYAILNPKQAACEYPFKELSGCGIGYKLCQAIAHNFDIPGQYHTDLMELLSLSIAADIVSMTGENRTLCFLGLKQLNKKPNTGIGNLINELSNATSITVETLVFQIAPKINAAGRMSHAKLAVELIIEGSAEQAMKLVKLNEQRRETDQQLVEDAIIMLENSVPSIENLSCIVVANPNWHKGVIGIAASRLVDKYHKPAIVFTADGDLLTASARSIPQLNIYEQLLACDHLLEYWGGHAFAAGLSIKSKNLETFTACINQQIDKELININTRASLTIDAEIDLEKITTSFYSILKQYAPFGPGNMKPIFMSKRVKATAKPQILKGEHLKFMLQTNKTSLAVIGFGLANKLSIAEHSYFDICYCITENSWKGRKSLQLELKDLKPSG